MPKTFGGRETVAQQRICHRKIHSTLSEKELRGGYATVEKFIIWLRKRPEGYYRRT
ncbi:MAG: hypothetical protein WDZ84_15185 [Rhodovibrionaceae bacterium]